MRPVQVRLRLSIYTEPPKLIYPYSTLLRSPNSHSGNKGSFGCNQKSGEIQCYGLYTRPSECTQQQLIITGFVAGWMTFIVSVRFIIP